MHLSESTFRRNVEMLEPIQNNFLNMIARVPKERDLRVEAHAAVHYTNAEIQDEKDDKEMGSDGETVLL